MQMELKLRRTMAVIVVGLLLAGLLAACGGEAQSTQTPAEESPTEVAAATETAPTAEAAAPTEEPMADNGAIDEEQPAEPAGPISCSAIEIPDNALTAAASTDDWSKGPADASITLIEYGDFQ
jgi:hypothetical protein